MSISVSETALAAFCRDNGIAKLAVFGSALEDDFGPSNDIDVLVEFESHRVPGLLGIAELEFGLARIFGGRRVDLRTPEDLSPYFRKDVVARAEVRYPAPASGD